LLGLSSRSEKAVDGVVVVVEDGDKRVGLVVDELLGQRQTVIKGLGPVFSSQKWASGAAILSNGHVGLIIDVAGIVGLTGRTHMVLPKPTESEPTESEPTESELTESEPTESEPAADLIPQLEAVLSD
jgi:chemotaxis protein histidine kinase CheA